MHSNASGPSTSCTESEQPPALSDYEDEVVTTALLTKRRSYSAAQKLEVIAFAKMTSIHKASQEFGVDRSCVRSWIRQENGLIAARYSDNLL
jgi:hypothetical protein